MFQDLKKAVNLIKKSIIWGTHTFWKYPHILTIYEIVMTKARHSLLGRKNLLWKIAAPRSFPPQDFCRSWRAMSCSNRKFSSSLKVGLISLQKNYFPSAPEKLLFFLGLLMLNPISIFPKFVFRYSKLVPFFGMVGRFVAWLVFYAAWLAPGNGGAASRVTRRGGGLALARFRT